MINFEEGERGWNWGRSLDGTGESGDREDGDRFGNDRFWAGEGGDIEDGERFGNDRFWEPEKQINEIKYCFLNAEIINE